MFAADPVCNLPQLAFPQGQMGAVHRFQQLRLQFRTVLARFKRARRVQRCLLVTVFDDNYLTLVSRGNELGKLALSFTDGKSFHAGSITLSPRTNKPCATVRTCV